MISGYSLYYESAGLLCLDQLSSVTNGLSEEIVLTAVVTQIK